MSHLQTVFVIPPLLFYPNFLLPRNLGLDYTLQDIVSAKCMTSLRSLKQVTPLAQIFLLGSRVMSKIHSFLLIHNLIIFCYQVYRKLKSQF